MRSLSRSILVASLIVFVLIIAATLSAQAQTFTVIYSFTGGLDGGNPSAGLSIDQAGNLYGTASLHGTPGLCATGSAQGCGTVFKLTRSSSGWLFHLLYSFTGIPDGAHPNEVVFGPDGSLYGTTGSGGGGTCPGGWGCGTIFNLRPSSKPCPTISCPWTETMLYRFSGGSDGGFPGNGDLVFDAVDNIYDTAEIGGKNENGVIYKLSPANGTWIESVLYTFTGGSDGANPAAGLTRDRAGNLYGTAFRGGYTGVNCLGFQWGPCGTVFQLTPSGSDWTENTLYAFRGGTDGSSPWGGLIFDPQGNLYGTTVHFIDSFFEGAGTVFELTPSNGSWAYTRVGTLGGGNQGPFADLVMDSAGNLYGTTLAGGAYGAGTVFELSPSGGGWTYTLLHEFTDGSDGASPEGSLILDGNGNIYGTAFTGGTLSNCNHGPYHGCGVVFEITP